MATSKNSPLLKAALFDLDGTLIETAPDLCDAVNQVLVQHADLPAIPEEVMRNFIGQGLKAMFAKALDHFGKSDEQLEELFNLGMKAYSSCNGRRSSPYDGIDEALQFLSDRNIPMGCVTNKIEEFTIPLLRQYKMNDYFSVIVSGDTLELRKPDPAPINYACRQLGVKESETYFIGDSSNDINSAIAAGTVAVCVDYGYTTTPPAELGAEIVISSINSFVRTILN